MNSPVGDPARPAAPRRWWWLGVAILAAAAVLTGLLTAHHGPQSLTSTLPASSASPASVRSTPASMSDFEVNAVWVLEGEAKWYDVPKNSLPQRRAWPGELTAASDRLPQESYVRVRRLDGQGDLEKTIVVRITDNGVHDKNTVIDLDRPAAEALGMLKAGQVRVRVEVLALRNASTDRLVVKKDDTPAAAKASALTDEPTASERQEKAAASAKP